MQSSTTTAAKTFSSTVTDNTTAATPLVSPVDNTTANLPTTAFTTTTTVMESSSNTVPSGVNAGAIAGGVVGGLIGLFIIVALLLYLKKKKFVFKTTNNKKMTTPQKNAAPLSKDVEEQRVEASANQTKENSSSGGDLYENYRTAETTPSHNEKQEDEDAVYENQLHPTYINLQSASPTAQRGLNDYDEPAEYCNVTSNSRRPSYKQEDEEQDEYVTMR